MQDLGRWIIWVFAVAGNGFLVFLWTVFGLAAAGTTQSTEARAFIWATAIGVGVPLLVSIRFASKRKFGVATGVTLLLMPSAVAFTLVIGSLI